MDRWVQVGVVLLVLGTVGSYAASLSGRGGVTVVSLGVGVVGILVMAWGLSSKPI